MASFLCSRAYGATDTQCKGSLSGSGTSAEFGARELKRTILRSLTQPLAALLADGSIEPGAVVKAQWSGGKHNSKKVPADPSHAMPGKLTLTVLAG